MGSRLARRIAVKGAQMSHQEVSHDERKWWFDIEEVDGALVPGGGKE